MSEEKPRAIRTFAFFCSSSLCKFLAISKLGEIRAAKVRAKPIQRRRWISGCPWTSLVSIFLPSLSKSFEIFQYICIFDAKLPMCCSKMPHCGGSLRLLSHVAFYTILRDSMQLYFEKDQIWNLLKNQASRRGHVKLKQVQIIPQKMTKALKLFESLLVY